MPPDELAAGEIIQRVRLLHGRLVEELALPLKWRENLLAILYLPAGDNAADSIIGLFDRSADLPGAIVLAFDSPLWRAQEENILDHNGLKEQDRLGKPGHGVFALLVTHPELPAMLENATIHPDEITSMTPFWEKGPQLQGDQPLLALVPGSLRGEMAQLASVARIHRSAHANADGKERRGGELSETMRMLLERVRIHAGLIEVAFAPEEGETSAKKKDKEEEIVDCGWLVHNAGMDEYAKKRLPAIGSALMYFGSELNPVETATNLAGTAGHWGRATSAGMLALAVSRVQALQAPVLCVEFMEQHSLSLTMLMPLSHPAVQTLEETKVKAA